MTTQICIATGQPLANLIPILHFKPRNIFLVVTNSMKVKAKDFKKILKDLDVSDSIFVLDGCPDTNLNAISQFLTEKLLPKLPDEGCIFNLTGGTKMHSFSIYETFKSRHDDDKFIYVDTNNRLLEYYPSKQASFHELLPSVLTAKMTLKGMGKTYIKAESNDAQWIDDVKASENLTRFIAQNIADKNVQNLIGSLNGIVGQLYNGGKSYILDKKGGELHQNPKGLAISILEKAHDNGLITWHDGKEISFDDYHQARYLSGIWLEEYVWLIANELGFEELHGGLQFGSQQATNQATNEIDLFIQHQNMALAIECKSATATKKSDNSQDMFHKLTGVANRAGGLMCSKLFVSAFALKTKNGNDIPAVYHAREQGIKIIQAEQIVNQLPEILKKWRDTGRL